MARRTRRPTVVWLPLSIENRIQENAAAVNGLANGGFQIGLIVTGGSSQNVALIPLVKDEPQNIAGAGETLSDLEGSAYRLRRIVGKIAVSPFQTSTIKPSTGAGTAFMVTAGIIVLRVDQAGAAANATVNSYDVQALDAARDPWIWRRSWFVSDVFQAATVNAAVPDSVATIFPSSNVTGYGSGNMDGPHIDAKTARVISDEERLFLVVSAISLDGPGSSQDTEVIAIFGEVRVLASMRKQSGNRRNASR